MDIEQAYQDTLNYLYGFVDYSLTKADRLAQAKFELSRMVSLLEKLGNPHQGYPIIHVTGTKGKGSVTAMCSHILMAAGYRTGMYTSPHLDDYTERIQIDGENIPHKELVDLVAEIKPVIESIDELTTFEITTALAFLYFKRKDVDAAVIEVGLGGRLDATNVVSPIVSVITSISFDHMFVLGDTLSKIAGEKGGIIKPLIPVVSAPQEAEALSVLEKIATERQSPLYLIGRDYSAELISHNLKQQNIEIYYTHPNEDEFSKTKSIQITIPLLGKHQIVNATVAFAAVDIFRKRSLPVKDQHIQAGFANTVWPGRFEILNFKPPVVLDCAHNRESMKQLAQTIRENFPGKRCVLIFGASEDKDITGMFDEIMPLVDNLIATQSFHPRAIQPEKLLEMAKNRNVNTSILANVAEAVHHAISNIQAKQIILVTGSIFVVAEARHAWYHDARFKADLLD